MRQRAPLTAPLTAPLLVLLLALPSTARAVEPTLAATELSDTPILVPRWYGWQPLMADLSSIATMAGGGFVRGEATAPVEIVGGGGYLLGAPLIHLIHGHPGKAGTSLLLRTVVPGVTALIGVLIAWAAFPNGTWTGGGDHFVGVDKSVYQAEGGFIGFGAGALAGMVVDDAVVAKEMAVPRDSEPAFAPRAAVVRGGATFGIGGTF